MSCRVAYARDQLGEESSPGLFITVVNFLMYQGAWLACLMGASTDRPAVGVIVASVVLAWHLNVSASPFAELKVALVTGLVGAVWEFLLLAMDWIEFPGTQADGVPPIWSLALWFAFATTLNVSLNGLKQCTLLAIILGAVGGPLAWAIAERMGALTLTEGGYSLLVISAGWALLLPLLSALAEWVVTERPHLKGRRLGHSD